MQVTISRESGVNSQNMQHFMSISSFQAKSVSDQIQDKICNTPGLDSGGVLILDDRYDEKAGELRYGASKQYNGLKSKVETSQVGVFRRIGST